MTLQLKKFFPANTKKTVEDIAQVQSEIPAVSTPFFPKRSIGLATHTGNMLDTQLVRITIPANTLGTNDSFTARAFFYSVFNSNVNKLRIKIGSTNVYSAATTVGYYTVSSTMTSEFFRRFILIGGTLYFVSAASANSSINDTSSTAPASMVFDPTVDNYIFFGCENGTSSISSTQSIALNLLD